MINDIYFLTQGSAGFVLPLHENVVYIEINRGDYFGEIDLMFAANENVIKIEDLVETMYVEKYNLQRCFTV